MLPAVLFWVGEKNLPGCAFGACGTRSHSQAFYDPARASPVTRGKVGEEEHFYGLPHQWCGAFGGAHTATQENLLKNVIHSVPFLATGQ